MKKNYFNKLLSLALVVTLGAALSSCGSSAYNTEAPYGDITGTYAKNNGHELTNKQLYDLLRPTGYSVLYNQVEEILLTNYKNESGDEINYLELDFNNPEDYAAMQQLLIETLFSVEEMEDFNKLSDDDFNDFVEQFIDSMYTMNIIVSESDLYKNASGIQFSTIVFDYFKLNLAKENFSKDRLEEIILKGEEYEEVVKEDGEIVLDSDGNPETETVKNSYWISDEDVENYYNTTYRHGLDYNAIIVGFNTIAECEDAIKNSSTSYGNPRFFADLYNDAYDYKTQLSYTTSTTMTIETFLNSGNNNANTTINADKLSSFNSSLSTFVASMDAGEYTNTYKEFGGKYYMVYKLTDTTSDQWEDIVDTLSEDEYETLFDEVYQEIFESKLTASFTSLQISEIIDELFEDELFEVYDPVFALLFESNFSNYTYEAQTLTDTKNVVKFTYNETEYTITPDELFEELAMYFGVSSSISYFTNYAIANSDLAANLDEDDEDAAQSAFDTELASFKENTYAPNGITSEFTEEQFLSMMFGYDNETDVINNYFMAQQAISYLAEDYSDLFFELLSLTGQNNFENYFDLTIKHVLLYVDYDLDGTLDNPQEFMDELTASQQSDFQKIITSIYSEIYQEARYLNGSISDNLDRIVRMYNDGDYLSYRRADSTKTSYTWDQIKTGHNLSLSSGSSIDFKIQIKVESLGTVDNSSATSYVTEFADHVEAMYNRLYAENKETFDADNSGKYGEEDLDYTADLLSSLTDYLDEEHLEYVKSGETSFDDLCMSSFGFHMLLSTSGSVASNAIFTVDDDRKADYEDDYKIYENIVITYDDEEYTLDGYSETAWPSVNQLKVYVYETNSDDGIENLKSDTETIINQFYSTFQTRYTDTTFVTYLIYNMLDMDIQFEDSAIATDMVDTWFEISKKQLDDYSDTPSIYAGWWDVIESYNWNAE